MNSPGTFTGVGVGPGPEGFISLVAWEALKKADLIFVPRAAATEKSIALQCLNGLDLPPERLREFEYGMDDSKDALSRRYRELAAILAAEVTCGRNVAYVTIGDSLTYSTYSYTLAALLDLVPDLPHLTYPGVTSYCAAASALEWPLGQGKERVLILPCPDDERELQQDIESHDIVVLMKIGHRLSFVLKVIHEMGIAGHCALASRIGLPGQLLVKNLTQLPCAGTAGYLTTMLIRKS